MKRLLLATAMTLALPGVALAERVDIVPGPYIGLGAGVNWLDRTTVQPLPGPWFPGETHHRFTFNTGWAVHGTLGYRFMDNWRAEIELAHRNNKIKSISNLPAGSYGKVKSFSQMINLHYDMPLGERLEFSLGAGIGGIRYDTPIQDRYVFGYQGIAGLAYNISQQTQLTTEYRYMSSNKVRLSDGVDTIRPKFNNHTITVGLRFALNPPAPVSLPPIVTPPLPSPTEFMVFFDFDKSNLTADAQRIVADAARTYREQGHVTVNVVGHTDTVGSATYNQALSERRAAAVRNELVRLGVPAGSIATEGRGFRDLLVRTGPGVREPQNRRATIRLNN
jgi:OOP family OmpA-OmpF porin